MMLKGSQRGGAQQLAVHLLNTIDNDHVEVHAIDGFISDDVPGALREIHAVSRATQCKQFMFSLSLSPPQDAVVTTEDYEAAIEAAAERLGLSDQPKVVLFHEKLGRRHCHVVFSRIDAQAMKAINLPFFKERLNELSHELFLMHGWDVPQGFKDRQQSPRLNYNHTAYQEAKAAKRDPKVIKALLLDCWSRSDGLSSFEAGLAEKGFVLARGDRRGFVVVDMNGKVYSLPRWLEIKPKDLRAKLGDPEYLPHVDEARAAFVHKAENAPSPLETVAYDFENNHRSKRAALEQEKSRIVSRQRSERESLEAKLAHRRHTKAQERQSQLKSGLMGLWDRVTGGHARKLDAIRAALEEDKIADNLERLALSNRHLGEMRAVQARLDRLHARWEAELQAEHGEVAQKAFACRQAEVSDKARAARIRKDPLHALTVITDKSAVFTQADIEKVVNKAIADPESRLATLQVIMRSSELVLVGERGDKTYYTTRSFIALEQQLLSNASAMAADGHFKVPDRLVGNAIDQENAKLRGEIGLDLSEEQSTAIRHVTGKEQLSCVVGVAGAGKSTMLAAAKGAWEQAGHRVIGAALAGKAAKGLEQASGIKSRTIASYEMSWRNDLHHLQEGDVLVVDEAGMIGSAQMSALINETTERGAKLVLVGDPEQLQPINAGTPFKDILENVGRARLDQVHRQKEDWQRQASQDFASGRVAEALSAYNDHGAIQLMDGSDEALQALVYDYMQDWVAHGDTQSRVALAHRRDDVREINEAIREMRKAIGELEAEKTFVTAHGRRSFATGDRLLFTRNDRELGVKNGDLGMIADLTNRSITVRLDEEDKAGKPVCVTIPIQSYNNIDHGYATTIHKSQGATVDRAYVMASRSTDRNLTYVAMTRHKERATLYAAKDEFGDQRKLCYSLDRDSRSEINSEFSKEGRQASLDHHHDQAEPGPELTL